jgi:hypothetical protein
MEHFNAAFFVRHQGRDGFTIHVPDPVKGHRVYHDYFVAEGTLERQRERLRRGEPGEDVSDLVTDPFAKKPRARKSFKQFPKRP